MPDDVSLDTVEQLTTIQIEAAHDIYGGLTKMPLRDRALLRLAAAISGNISRLPKLLHQSTLIELADQDIPARMRVRYEAMLSKIEAAVP